MRRHLAIAATLLGLTFVGGVPASQATSPAARTPTAVAAKSCKAGYVHAVIGRQEKCLRRGEFCAHRYQRQYKRYGFDCTRRDSRGNYHLT
jgi:hypothetical protein